MWFKSSFTIPAVAAISFCLIGGTSPAAADILHVPGDFPTIQAAIAAAMDGDEVEVHPGAYFETINFLGKAIRVYSTDGPDVTIIDAQQTGTVVTCNSGEGPDTVLDGFTVTGGEPSGMRNVGSSPTVTNCTFSGNTAFGGGGDGGGIFNVNNSNATVTNCTFSGNSADDRGGGMSNHNSSPMVIDCTFSGNTVGGFPGFGGGMFNSGGSPTVTNCTFSSNSATNGNALAFDFGPSELTMANCILWDGGNEISNNDGSTITIGYTDVQGGWPGLGNIDADPMFVDPGIGDLRLLPGSPCIDAADNTAVPKGIDTDLDGNPRFVDDPATKDTGNGDPPIVDMGAYEFQVTCPWDVNGDGVVDHHDILEVVHNLGRCNDPDNCPWDVNGDGIVNGRDVAAVARHFGSCP